MAELNSGASVRETIDDNNEIAREPKLPPDQDLMNTAEMDKIPQDDDVKIEKGGDETIPPTASVGEINDENKTVENEDGP